MSYPLVVKHGDEVVAGDQIVDLDGTTWPVRRVVDDGGYVVLVLQGTYNIVDQRVRKTWRVAVRRRDT